MNPEDVDPQEELAAMRAAIDQAKATATDIADLANATYTAHVRAGFTEAQALALTQTWYRVMLCGEYGAGHED